MFPPTSANEPCGLNHAQVKTQGLKFQLCKDSADDQKPERSGAQEPYHGGLPTPELLRAARRAQRHQNSVLASSKAARVVPRSLWRSTTNHPEEVGRVGSGGVELRHLRTSGRRTATLRETNKRLGKVRGMAETLREGRTIAPSPQATSPRKCLLQSMDGGQHEEGVG